MQRYTVLMVVAVIMLSITTTGAYGLVNVTSWNYSTGYTYLMASYAAYCPRADLNRWDCKWCNNNTDISSFKVQAFASDFKTDTFGYISVSKSLKQVMVSFRGTQADSLRNWAVDLKAAKLTPYQNYTGVQVHEGFQKAYLALKNQVLSAVQTQLSRNPGYAVVLTGHSLGAALATLAAIDISRITTQVYVWHYGSPRVGNRNFSTLFSSAIKVHYRVVNNRDMIAHMPPMNYDFYHIPTEVWERGTSATSFKVCDNSGEDPTCSDSRADLSIEDHLNYFGVYESC